MTEQPDKASKPRRGRPKGSRNRRVQQATVKTSRCQKCGSTDRTNYHHTHEQEYAGEHDGLPFTHIIRRYTSCQACGQERIDRFYEHRTVSTPAEDCPD